VTAIELGAARLPDDVRRELVSIFGEAGVSSADAERIAYSQDRWPLGLIWTRAGKVPYPPDAVVWPERTEQVSALLRLANRLDLPVVPYGGGSGVCGGTVPVRGGIVLDLKRMDRVLSLREEALLLEVEAGALGQPLEEAVNRRGYTLGHFPSSMACSTVGGWLAARSAGQLSTKYGKIEDLCVGLEAVLPAGDVVVARPVPRAATGPDWKQLLIGSEGTLGVITKAWLRVAPAPDARAFRSFRFPTVDAGLRAIRETLRRGLRPAAVRLYDPMDTLVGVAGGQKGGGAVGSAIRELVDRAKSLLLAHPQIAPLVERFAGGGCHSVFVFEGDRDLVELEEAAVARIAAAAGGEDRGPAPAERWYGHRYDISFKQSAVFHEGAFVDTMEVVAPWDVLPRLYEAVKGAVSGLAVALAHFSHAYPEGCSIYFTFAAACETDAASESRYREIWDAALTACLGAGGTISHHHGIGLSKARFMERELGGFLAAYRAVKRALDPRNILNPGKMGLD